MTIEKKVPEPSTPSESQRDIVDKPLPATTNQSFASFDSRSQNTNQPGGLSNGPIAHSDFPLRGTVVEQEVAASGSAVNASCDTESDTEGVGIDPFDDEFDAQFEDNDLGLANDEDINHVDEHDNEERGGEEGGGEDGGGEDGEESGGKECDGDEGDGLDGKHISLLRHDLPTSCVYKGYVCHCGPHVHEYDPSLPSSSVAHVDETCKILQSLNLKFHKRHRYLICTCAGGSFVALHDLKSHMKIKHVADLRDGNTRTMRRDFTPALEHILTSFKLSMSQKPVNFDKDEFDGPIAGISKPRRFYLCPSPGCKIFGGHIESLKAHFNKTHRSSGAFCSKSAQIRWTQHPFASRGSHSARVEVANRPAEVQLFPCQDHAGPSKVHQYVVPQGVAAIGLPWLDHVGWTTWRNDLLRAGHTICTLRDLVSLPKKVSKLCLQASLPPTGDVLLFLIGTWIQARLEKMLEDANTWLDGSELRSAITVE